MEDNNKSTVYKDEKANEQYNSLYREFEKKVKKEQEQEQAQSKNPTQNNNIPLMRTQEDIIKTRNEADTIVNEKLSAKEKLNNPLDISLIIDKIDKLDMPATDKAFLLNQIKQNMRLPSLGEDESINRIHNKYITEPNTQHQNQSHMLQPQPQQNQQYPQQYPQQYLQQYPQQYPLNIMTTMHYDILKNKLDAVQLELVDLLRHVKDYTQRYMNATRQQDMEKIDAYITSLFNIDKQLEEVKEVKEEASKINQNITASDELEEPEELEDTQQSIISKATNGIKNFFGGIGNNVAGVAKLVSSTANVANNYLSKKVIGTNKTEPNSSETNTVANNTTTASPTVAKRDNTINTNNTIDKNIDKNIDRNIIKSSNTNFNNTSSNTSTTTTNNKQGTNIVSINEYIASNANQINNLIQQKQTPEQQTPEHINNTQHINEISSNANNINSLTKTNINTHTNEQDADNNSINKKDSQNNKHSQNSKNNIIISNDKEFIKPNTDNADDTITQSINELNTHINDSTTSSQNLNTNTNINTKQNSQAGGTRINKLHKNIDLLKLKITKHKLKKELHNIQTYKDNNKKSKKYKDDKDSKIINVYATKKRY